MACSDILGLLLAEFPEPSSDLNVQSEFIGLLFARPRNVVLMTTDSVGSLLRIEQDLPLPGLHQLPATWPHTDSRSPHTARGKAQDPSGLVASADFWYEAIERARTRSFLCMNDTRR